MSTPDPIEFKPDKWLCEKTLRASCLAVRGAWADLLCHMQIEDTDRLSGTVVHFAKLLGVRADVTGRVLSEMINNHVCDAIVDNVPIGKDTLPGTCPALSRSSNACVTIVSRRRQKERNDREHTRLRQERRRSSLLSLCGVTTDVTPVFSDSPVTGRDSHSYKSTGTEKTHEEEQNSESRPCHANLHRTAIAIFCELYQARRAEKYQFLQKDAAGVARLVKLIESDPAAYHDPPAEIRLRVGRYLDSSFAQTTHCGLAAFCSWWGNGAVPVPSSLRGPIFPNKHGPDGPGPHP